MCSKKHHFQYLKESYGKTVQILKIFRLRRDIVYKVAVYKVLRKLIACKSWQMLADHKLKCVRPKPVLTTGGKYAVKPSHTSHGGSKSR